MRHTRTPGRRRTSEQSLQLQQTIDAMATTCDDLISRIGTLSQEKEALMAELTRLAPGHAPADGPPSDFEPVPTGA